MKFPKLLFLLYILVLFPLFASAQTPATEVRAVWLTTNWGLDWPRAGTSVETQKQDLINILEQLAEENINMVLFQTRLQGTVMYNSSIEPSSRFYNQSGGFDPLQFAIEECHKRRMECHAWMITYPMGQAKYSGKGKNKRLAESKPDYYKLVNGSWYLDPGRPEARQLIMSLVDEVVRNYDVDGVHFDYIRYPSNDKKFPDSESYRMYSNGESLYDWRRDNINTLVSDIYDSVKGIKNWVQVSSSPLGRYQVLPHAPRDGWTAYETVFQDAGSWMRNGKHDLLFPMMYYRNHLFYPFVDDWMANSNGRIVVPGLGVYQMMSGEQNWSISEITDQIDYLREHKVPGQAYFRAANILSNLKGLKESISEYYPYPAKLPALTWLDNVAPNSPLNLEVYRGYDGQLYLQWETPDNSEDFTYTVYVSDQEFLKREEAPNIIATGIRGNSFSFPISEGDFGSYYSVSASDRYHNESVACFPAFFSHSLEVQ